MNIKWFNLSAPRLTYKKLSVRLWNIFNRRSTDGHFWGFGLLQVNGRHLLYVGHSGVGLLFFGKPGQYESWREQAIMAVGQVYTWLKNDTVQVIVVQK